MDQAVHPAKRTDERTLLAGMGDADPAAFEAFYGLYFPRVHAYALRRSGDPAKAERLTEEILEAALGALQVGPAAAPLAIQVLRVARSVAGRR